MSTLHTRSINHGAATVPHGIRGMCGHRGWNLLAAHIRTNHVHVAAEAEIEPAQPVFDRIGYVVDEQGDAMAVFAGVL
jgi:hypothetical protein